ncbi:MerR family transcriptional regulator [Nocardia sp. NBC_00511]|uniref:MerR family transcriptional regulator n=1 Tax=Nocardia sp. NBC_00511 TaxID=2903591 RepID=UPI0030E5756A
MEYTIDELARAAEMTVRSVRVYHERGLLPSPDVRGRTGYYSMDHLTRLNTIARLLNRGMKLNGIRELLDAWDRGDGLAELLGVTDQPSAESTLDAGPADTTVAVNRTPDQPDTLETPTSDDNPLETYRLANPRCYDLATRLTNAGLPAPSAFELIERLRLDCARLVAGYTDDIGHLLRSTAVFESSREPGDPVLESDLTIANLMITRATVELIDLAALRSRDQPPTSS